MKKKKICLNLCCGVLLHGEREEETWINVDNTLTKEGIESKEGLYTNVKTEEGYQFVQADIRQLPFEDESADYVECLEGIEHVPFAHVPTAIQEMHRVLKVGGEMALMTTDMDGLCAMWTEHISGRSGDDLDPAKWSFLLQTFYGNQVSEGEFHRSGFNATYLNYLMQEAGFTDYKMTYYPHGCAGPDLKGVKWGHLTIGAPMLLVIAKKT
jgi:SAM-dependent methyltransferase